MTVERGSEWRKWDLHVHTPASVVHHYPGADDSEKWDTYLDALEQLPPEFAVLGISDYYFLEGYSRLQQERASGRLQNIELLLPVVELRLSSFGGTDSRLSRVNAHVVFSDAVSPELIESQFYPRVTTEYELSPSPDGVRWDGILTRESLKDLGERVLSTLPDDKKADYADPFTVGFETLTLDLGKIKSAIDSEYFKGRAVLAIGRTEWADVKWNAQSVADKKTLINSARIIFTAASDLGSWERAKQALSDAEVRDTLLDCSDAHAPQDATDQKDRLGNCLTWIKADPTFDGLRQALVEPAERIWVGDRPLKLDRMHASPAAFIDRVELGRTAECDLEDIWFDDLTVPLNPGLVAIIGNKGMGKSALAEAMVTALGSTIGQDHFSFLTTSRFCQPSNNLGRHFVVRVHGCDGREAAAHLSDDPMREMAGSVAFLPQNYLEKLCADPAASRDFEQELEKVVFSHVPMEARIRKESLGSLLEHLTQETNRSLGALRAELSEINAEIVDLENATSTSQLQRLGDSYRAKRREVLGHKAMRPQAVAKPADDPELAARIENKRSTREGVRTELAKRRTELGECNERKVAAARLREALTNVQRELDVRVEGWQVDLDLLGLKKEQLLTLSVVLDPLDLVDAEQERLHEDLTGALDPELEGSLANQDQQLTSEIAELNLRLKMPGRTYQAYVEAESDWLDQRRRLIGGIDSPESLLYLRKRMAEATKELPARLDEAIASRDQKAGEILAGVAELAAAHQRLHRPVQDFIDGHESLQESLGLQFEVSVDAGDLIDRFFGLVHNGRRGYFHGVDEGRKRLEDLLEAYDFSDSDQAAAFARELHSHLTEESDGASGSLRIAEQLLDGHTVAEVLDLVFGFSYLRPASVIRKGDLDLEALSPGERGLLLLVFYLLVSKDEGPVIVDQPEGNLDNESIFKVLVPCICEAKKHRQVVIVTHNPNLAVVCDAEQVIRAQIDKEKGNKVSYIGGAIENREINDWLVDVLEGTWPAFDTRQRRYFGPQSPS